MTQAEALDILKTGANIFLTGEPGAGKTYVLNQYIAWLDHAGIPVAVTASTGIAATHIGGMTIHSWSSIGMRESLTSYDLDHIVSKEATVKRVKKAKVLVIDEISMLDGRILGMVDAICRTVRGSTEAFGGLQVIFVGDFFQLPPVSARGSMSQFAFESESWQAARVLTCYLMEQHRQEDELLLGLLTSMRKNDISDEHYTLLSEQTSIAYENIEPTKLFTHNQDVDSVNLEQLGYLNTERATYRMEIRGNKQLAAGLVKSCLSPEVLELRREAMVMCTKNNFEAGYVNGTLGRVIDFDRDDGFPLILTTDGRQIKIVPQSWSIEEDGKVRAEIIQVPLRLAWAITVHKSQGMSLDAAEIDLRNAFTYGQGYVALSRVRTLAGMKVLGLNSRALLVDPRVVHRDEWFRRESDEAERIFREMDDTEKIEMQKQFVKGVGGVWREEGEIPTGEKPRTHHESTYLLTHDLLSKGKTPKEIAKERSMALSTIWGHIEKLSAEGVLSRDTLAPITSMYPDWDHTYKVLGEAFDQHGTEKLKPIFDSLNEEYEYDLIRLGRILYSFNHK